MGRHAIPIEERLADWSMPVTETGCIIWLGALNTDGYGKVSHLGKSRIAHIVAYELKYGAVPEGRELDHKCRQRLCVNPRHLEPVTHVENMRRSAGLKTHCPHGHQYSEENTYYYRGSRICRACSRLRAQECYRKKIAKGTSRGKRFVSAR